MNDCYIAMSKSYRQENFKVTFYVIHVDKSHVQLCNDW